MKLILASGGGAADSHPLDEIFARWIDPRAGLLYLPSALRGIRPFGSCLEWVTSTFVPLVITDIMMWAELSDHRENELELKYAAQDLSRHSGLMDIRGLPVRYRQQYLEREHQFQSWKIILEGHFN